MYRVVLPQNLPTMYPTLNSRDASASFFCSWCRLYAAPSRLGVCSRRAVPWCCLSCVCWNCGEARNERRCSPDLLYFCGDLRGLGMCGPAHPASGHAGRWWAAAGLLATRPRGVPRRIARNDVRAMAIRLGGGSRLVATVATNLQGILFPSALRRGVHISFFKLFSRVTCPSAIAIRRPVDLEVQDSRSNDRRFAGSIQVTLSKFYFPLLGPRHVFVLNGLGRSIVLPCIFIGRVYTRI